MKKILPPILGFFMITVAACGSGSVSDDVSKSEKSSPFVTESAQPSLSDQSDGETLAPSGQSDETTPSAFEAKQTETAETGIFRYYLYTPKNARENMPLLVYLHGGSGKGDDLSLLTESDGFPKYLKDGLLGDPAAYIVIPQVSSNKKGWPEIRASLTELIRKTSEEYGSDTSKISLTGHSMGGTGTWNIALKEAASLYKIAPLSGSIATTEENINALKNVGIWAMVGSADTVVSPDSTVAFIDEIKKVNENARLTVFAGATHFDVPALAYLDPQIGLLDWLIS